MLVLNYGYLVMDNLIIENKVKYLTQCCIQFLRHVCALHLGFSKDI